MSISVIIPAYNEEQYIGKAIEALLHQTEPADEIIVVDNSSTDNTASIIKRYDVRYIKEGMQGLIPARNRGFDEATSDLLARMDADSLPPPNWITEIKRVFADQEVYAATGPVTLYDAPVKTSLFSQFYFYSLYFYLHHHVLFGPNMVIRKKVWNEIKNTLCLADSEVHEDIDLTLHIPEPEKHVKFDKHLVSTASARRIMKNPQSFFGEYTMRLINMMKNHHRTPHIEWPLSF